MDRTAYAALPTEESTLEPALGDVPNEDRDPTSQPALTLQEKWELVKPLLLKFMLPLFLVYTLEYTINQGISPTLVYTPPSQTPVLRWIITSIRDYYPLWQLVYQTTVFVSRSALTLGLPPVKVKYLPLPAVIQSLVLSVLALESATGIFEGGSTTGDGGALAILLVAFLIGIEGLCGGLAYVNTFYHLSSREAEADGDHESQSDNGTARPETPQEREFKIGSMGFADSTGILLASLISVPVEIGLCEVQVGRGRGVCREL